MEKIISYTIKVGSIPNENDVLDKYFEEGWRVKSMSTVLLDGETKYIVVTVNLTKELSIR